MFSGNKNEGSKSKTNVIILKEKTEYPEYHVKSHAKHQAKHQAKHHVKHHAKKYSKKHNENYEKNYGHESKDHENSGGIKIKMCVNCQAGQNQFTNPSYARKCPGIYPIPYPGANLGTS